MDDDETFVKVTDGGGGDAFAHAPAHVNGGYGLNLVNALGIVVGRNTACARQDGVGGRRTRPHVLPSRHARPHFNANGVDDEPERLVGLDTLRTRSGPYASPEGMPSRRRPPTFIPGSAVDPSGDDPALQVAVSGFRPYDESKILPVEHATPM